VPADGVVSGGRFIPLGAFASLDGVTIADLLPAWPRNLGVLRAALAGGPGADPAGSWPASGIRLLPPVTPPQIFQVALNYADHAAEMALPIPQQPFVFAGLPSALCGACDDVVLPLAGQHDWELELAVVIRRRARHVDRAGAADCIAGYTIANDLTTRDRLRRPEAGRTDYVAAKNPPTFLPTGPFLVPADEVDAARLPMTLSVNGEVMQLGSTATMVFDVPDLIATLSAQVELLPGDLLLTGTPAGTGHARGRFLRPGDLIEAAIGGLGQQRNRCVAGQAPRSGAGGRRAA
jgi:2-keto-4-pentenoate hydratase/2-oxohepta-3-ene-1,7-dioic acid hydratase in catechol pathway